MSSFIPMKQVYCNVETGERSTDYASLLPDRLTLDKTFTASRFKRRTERRTLFREVVTAPLGDLVTPALRGLFNLKRDRDFSGAVLVEMRALLRDAVERSWRPDLFHVVMHSSGFDSRGISWTIKELVEEKGEEWLGPGVLFLCSIREGAEFKKIMKHEGWDESRYAVVKDGVPMSEYYTDSLLGFGRAWQRLGGASAIPVNLFWYPVEWAAREGLIPTADVQMYTGQWGNTISDPGSAFGREAGLKKAMILFYYSVLFQRPFNCVDLVHPYADFGMARLTGSLKARLSAGFNVRKAFVRSLDEKLMDGFVNMASNGDREVPIASWIAEKIMLDYDKSWYGRKVRPGARPRRWWTEFDPFWSYWSSASLCEHLLGAGCRIKVV